MLLDRVVSSLVNKVPGGAPGQFLLIRSLWLAAVDEASERGPLFVEFVRESHPAPRVSRDEPSDAIKPLTSRESAVIQLATIGYSKREIADELFVAERTVELHLERALKKSGARSIEELKGLQINARTAASGLAALWLEALEQPAIVDAVAADPTVPVAGVAGELAKVVDGSTAMAPELLARARVAVEWAGGVVKTASRTDLLHALLAQRGYHVESVEPMRLRVARADWFDGHTGTVWLDQDRGVHHLLVAEQSSSEVDAARHTELRRDVTAAVHGMTNAGLPELVVHAHGSSTSTSAAGPPFDGPRSNDCATRTDKQLHLHSRCVRRLRLAPHRKCSSVDCLGDSRTRAGSSAIVLLLLPSSCSWSTITSPLSTHRGTRCRRRSLRGEVSCRLIGWLG